MLLVSLHDRTQSNWYMYCTNDMFPGNIEFTIELALTCFIHSSVHISYRNTAGAVSASTFTAE